MDRQLKFWIAGTLALCGCIAIVANVGLTWFLAILLGIAACVAGFRCRHGLAATLKPILGAAFRVLSRTFSGVLAVIGSLAKSVAAKVRERQAKRLAARPLLVAAAHEAGLNRDYRLVGDPAMILRINQPWPPGIEAHAVKLIADWRDGVPVAGISHGSRPADAKAFMRGSDRLVFLERDPTNKHDRNAIRVIGRWRSSRGAESEAELGWVPRECAKMIATEYPSGMPLGATLTMMFLPKRGHNPGLRIAIGRPGMREVRVASWRQDLSVVVPGR